VNAITEALIDGFLTVDQTGTVETFNAAAEQIFGLRRSDAIGKNLERLVSHRPDDAWGRAIRSSSTTTEKSPVGKAGLYENITGIRGDGTTFPTDIAVSTTTSDGSPLHLVIARDITERQVVDQMKRQFVSLVSHELRTPLTSIRGSLGLLAGGAFGALGEAPQPRVFRGVRTVICERCT
jgi:PAS domain S-box-containing protein